MESYVISPANLEIIEGNLNAVANSLKGMSNNIGTVSQYVNKVDNRVNDVSAEVKSLSEQIRDFMNDTKNLNVVSNAKQSIVLDNQEIDRKYSHYDEIRRQVLGILQASDMDFIKNSTISTMSEENILKAPNYWLARALMALSSWLNNNPEIANKALKEAMNIDDEKTSLFFSLIGIRSKKMNVLYTWLSRYLSMQDPSKMEKKIITVLDMYASGVLNIDGGKLLMNNITTWCKELNNLNGIKEQVHELWVKFFKRKLNEIYISDSEYPYLNEKCANWSVMKSSLQLVKLNNLIYNFFSEILNTSNKEFTYMNNQVDELINDLIYNYDNEESELRKDILKNKLIIEEDGDVKKAYERFDDISFGTEKVNNFYVQLTNIIQNPNYVNTYSQTRKIAIVILKDIIINAYMEVTNEVMNQARPNFSIKIADWEGLTSDGKNEKSVIDSLYNYIDSVMKKELFGEEKVNYKIIISIGLIVLGIVLGFAFSYYLLVICLIGLIYGGIELNNINNDKKVKMKRIRDVKKNAGIVISNCMAEVINYNKVWQDNTEKHQSIITLLSNLNIDNYISRTSDNNYHRVLGVGNDE